MRSLGFRARLVTGFLADEFNHYGGYYVVREQNAHAWVEVWSDAAGWKRFDATPAEGLAAWSVRRSGWSGQVADAWDWLQERWMSGVITFDEAQRRSLVSRMAEAWRGFTGFLAGNQLPVILIGVWMVWGGLRKLLQNDIRRSAAAASRIDPASVFYLAMLRLLERAGYRRSPGQTPRRFSEALKAEDAQRFAAVEHLTELYEQVRFGGRPMTEAVCLKAQDLLTELKLCLRRKPPQVKTA